jgi:hypothetical protein
VLVDRNRRPVSTADAHLILADIPVVRLRDGLPRGLLGSKRSYSDIVAAAQETVGRPEMAIDLAAKSLSCGGKAVPLPPITFAFAAWLAERAIRFSPEQAAIHWSKVDWNEFLAVYARLPDQKDYRVAALRKRLAGEGQEEFFNEQVARLRSAMQKTLEAGAPPYEPRSFGKRPLTRVGFALPGASITLRDARSV